MKKYAIIDIETTGGLTKRDRITEVAIIIFNGSKIIEQFDSLVYPERSIPPEITRITGITDQMVQNAPKFYEIAKRIVEITEGAIFVAHNVRFDYTFIREEYKRLGYTFTRRQLCTVKLSRKVFPGFRSYSLGNLIRHFNIQVKNRHRALDDALATTEILHKIILQESSANSLKELIHHGVKESQLPKTVSLEQLHALPEETGVYYFYNQYKDVIYVGKAKNIQQRIFQHFRKTSPKAARLYQRVHDISYELTGNELTALLVETREIKRLNPEINKAQKVKDFAYYLTSYPDEDGYMKLDIQRNSKKNKLTYPVLREYSRLKYARQNVDQLIHDFKLCNQLSYHQQNPSWKCHCASICQLAEPNTYNAKVTELTQLIENLFDRDFLIVESGRNTNENAIIGIRYGKYYGYNFLDQDAEIPSNESIFDDLIKQPYYPIMNKLIWNYLQANNPKIIVIK